MVGEPTRRPGAARDHRVSRTAHGRRLFRVQGPAHRPADADVASDHQRVEARSEDYLLSPHPTQVARSLNERDGFSFDTGEQRRFSYTVDFCRYTKSAEICTIEYEAWF